MFLIKLEIKQSQNSTLPSNEKNKTKLWLEKIWTEGINKNSFSPKMKHGKMKNV